VSVKEDTVVWLTTNRATTWFMRHVASHLDPLVFKASNGRYFSLGRASMPMVTLTTTGARSGKPRAVHLACLEFEGDPMVVASAMGQERHPGWSYNLEADPAVEVQVEGERYAARAERLDAEQKARVWSQVHAALPQMKVYEGRTARDIRLYRLRRVAADAAGGAR
jgi:deazaflavin-dependent oxidoreductase (nitroreductase family)